MRWRLVLACGLAGGFGYMAATEAAMPVGDHDPQVMHHLGPRPCGCNREGHADHAGVHPAARRGRRVHPVEREDEECRRDHVGELDQGVDHGRWPSPGFCSLLNILSIRWVMRNPLTMLVMDANTATAPRNRISTG